MNESDILIGKILRYCKQTRDMLDRQNENIVYSESHVNDGRIYELTKIIDMIESEEIEND